MYSFDKKDIKALDFIVDETLKDKIVTPDNLNELYDSEDLTIEFKRLLFFIEKHKACECITSEDSEFIRKNSKTLNFKINGGFKKLYTDLEELKEQENNKIRKAKIDLDLAEKTLKDYPRTKKFATISLIIAIILALVQLIKWITELSSK